LKDFHFSHPDVTLLQYVDDLLLAADTEEACRTATRDLLRTRNDLGYRVSAKKAQLCSTEVTYLGHRLKGGERTLSESRIQAIPTTKAKRQVREFLRAAGYCRLWILGFAEICQASICRHGEKEL
jgi:hypothetical protein